MQGSVSILFLWYSGDWLVLSLNMYLSSLVDISESRLCSDRKRSFELSKRLGAGTVVRAGVLFFVSLIFASYALLNISA